MRAAVSRRARWRSQTSATPEQHHAGPGEHRPIAAVARQQEADSEQHHDRDEVRRAQRELHVVEDHERNHDREGRQEHQQEDRERPIQSSRVERRPLAAANGRATRPCRRLSTSSAVMSDATTGGSASAMIRRACSGLAAARTSRTVTQVAAALGQRADQEHHARRRGPTPGCSRSCRRAARERPRCPAVATSSVPVNVSAMISPKRISDIRATGSSRRSRARPGVPAIRVTLGAAGARR